MAQILCRDRQLRVAAVSHHRKSRVLVNIDQRAHFQRAKIFCRRGVTCRGKAGRHGKTPF